MLTSVVQVYCYQVIGLHNILSSMGKRVNLIANQLLELALDPGYVTRSMKTLLPSASMFNACSGVYFWKAEDSRIVIRHGRGPDGSCVSMIV